MTAPLQNSGIVLPGAAPLRELHGVDRERFEREIVPAARPVVLRGLVDDWPAAKFGCESAEAICRYLVGLDNGTPIDAILLAPQEKGRIFYNAAFDGFNFLRNRLPLSRVIEQIARYSQFDEAPAVAAQSALIRGCLPRFLDAHPMPLLDAVEPRIWLGNAITVPAHFDETDNIACVVAGRRRFTLFPPEQIANLYIGPLDFAPTGTPISLVDFAAPDPQRFPNFTQACAHALTAELLPGDALFIPALWWHHVQSLDVCNILVNYWWNAAGLRANESRDCLLHAMLTLRRLPDAQRAAWAPVFQHYVFGAVESTRAHIPPQRRGVLGDLDEAAVSEQRHALAKRLERD
jgi:hypothetical protein